MTPTIPAVRRWHLTGKATRFATSSKQSAGGGVVSGRVWGGVSMYGPDDPRSNLGAAASTAAVASTPYAAGSNLRFAAAEYVKFHDLPGHHSANPGRTWYARGQNFVISYSEAAPGTVLSREDQADE